jgi:hypothetical protein
MDVHSCESCPFYTEAVVGTLGPRGRCCLEPSVLILGIGMVRKGCSKHPDNMQQYEELRGHAWAKGAREFNNSELNS